ncbi:uncharacterized protein ColSpa_09223 [Colletotrichum spaethianum]|uniref:Uncharacterized protein n=1 Tax=Colletotrichum spaethianum TaxID=700344 RepID=A0AA37PB91_9PEZI|nr:uncharacterized protein ColSpa_09223 [Colletotrichum spaethianum]GKT49042.1 hypothetical protein ColSpa_09223 [Colletotrichum spaethianum]
MTGPRLQPKNPPRRRRMQEEQEEEKKTPRTALEHQVTGLAHGLGPIRRPSPQPLHSPFVPPSVAGFDTHVQGIRPAPFFASSPRLRCWGRS